MVATPNLNGDYLSDAAAALTGGIGLAAGANIGDRAAMFEATHGTAPKYTGKNMANPGAVLLSGVLLLEHLGWYEAADLVNKALEATFAESEETAQKGPRRQAVRDLRHRPPVRRLRRESRRHQQRLRGADYPSSLERRKVGRLWWSSNLEVSPMPIQVQKRPVSGTDFLAEPCWTEELSGISVVRKFASFSRSRKRASKTR